MMKNLLVLILVLSGRIVVILVAALAVVWVTMSIVDTSGTTPFPPERRGEFAQQGAVAGNPNGEPQRGERHGPQDQSLGDRLTFGLFGMLKNFVIIGIVAVIGVGLERFFTRQPVKASL